MYICWRRKTIIVFLAFTHTMGTPIEKRTLHRKQYCHKYYDKQQDEKSARTKKDIPHTVKQHKYRKKKILSSSSYFTFKFYPLKFLDGISMYSYSARVFVILVCRIVSAVVFVKDNSHRQNKLKLLSVCFFFPSYFPLPLPPTPLIEHKFCYLRTFPSLYVWILFGFQHLLIRFVAYL